MKKEICLINKLLEVSLICLQTVINRLANWKPNEYFQFCIFSYCIYIVQIKNIRLHEYEITNSWVNVDINLNAEAGTTPCYIFLSSQVVQ